MNTITKKRFLVSLVVVLIIINISALSTMVFNKYHKNKNTDLQNTNNQYRYNRGDKRPKMYHMRVKNFVKQELSLSDKQYEQYVKLKDINIEKSDIIMRKIGERKKLIFKAYCQKTMDTVALNEMADETGFLHAKMQKETLRHFQAVEKILTPAQLVKFRKMLCNMSNRNRHGHYQKEGKRRRMNFKNN